MEILIAHEPIDEATLAELARSWYHTLVKGVADIERGVLALGGEWHMDANNILIGDGSEQQNLWGFNLYPAKQGNEAIEYNSLINIRPAQDNRAMEIASPDIRIAVCKTVSTIVPFLGL